MGTVKHSFRTFHDRFKKYFLPYLLTLVETKASTNQEKSYIHNCFKNIKMVACDTVSQQPDSYSCGVFTVLGVTAKILGINFTEEVVSHLSHPEYIHRIRKDLLLMLFRLDGWEKCSRLSPDVTAVVGISDGTLLDGNEGSDDDVVDPLAL